MTTLQVAFIASSLESAYKYQRVLSDLGANVAPRSIAQMKTLFSPGTVFDLAIFEAIERASSHVSEMRLIAENQGIPLLMIVDKAGLATLRLPNQVPSDFVMVDAGPGECAARMRRLLGKSAHTLADDKITVENMVINTSTYQVTVEGEPIDLTYLEYALLTFLAQHPSRTFTRDTLLQNVWGFDYYGGSRTVDVHVRRIRSKLGPKLAEHLRTIRGVGYLWNAESD